MTRQAAVVLAWLTLGIACQAQDVLPPTDDPPAQDTTPVQPQPRGPGKPLRAGDRPGPWDHDVLLYRVPAGAAPEPAGTFERSGVPNVIRDATGRLVAVFQWFPADSAQSFDRVAARFSEDEGKTWSEPTSLEFDGLPTSLRRPFDPTLVLLPDGRLRLYFTSHPPSHSKQPQAAIYSAVSTDAIHFTFEPGQRFQVDGHMVVDCAVARLGETYHLFAPSDGPADGRGFHAVSSDGLKFERKEDVILEGKRRWLGCVVAEGAGLRFYGTSDEHKPGADIRVTGIWTALSPDGIAWTPEQAPTVLGADPGVVTLKDGSKLILTTGPPRPGTPSARGSLPAQRGGKPVRPRAGQ